jgi:hypothetical protein
VLVFEGVTLSWPKLMTDYLTSGSILVYLLVFALLFNNPDFDLFAPSSSS